MEIAEILCIAMFAVTCGFLMFGFPVAFTLAGASIFFAALGVAMDAFTWSLFGALPSRIFGNAMTNEVLIAVPLFIFMGVMLERSKVAEELLDSMGMLFGSMRGGLGVSVSIVGALLAASTGIVGATVVTMGLLSLPTMLKRGYNPSLACGSICAAGTLGQIIPPSIVLVLLGDQISNAYSDAQRSLGNFSPEPVSVGDLFAGALIPGLGLVGMYILYQLLVAWFKPETSPPIPAEELNVDGLGKRIAHALIPPIVLIVAVLGSILAGVATPTEAAAVGSVGAILLAGLRLDESHGGPFYGAGLALVIMLILTNTMDLRLGMNETSMADTIGIAAVSLCGLVLAFGIFMALKRVYQAEILANVCRSTMDITSMVFVILIGASVFSLVFRGLGGDDMVHEMLSDLPGGVVGAMIVVMLVMFFLGFFLDFIEITFVVVPIVAPVLLMMDLNPVWLGVMMAMNLQTSFLTPPFGFALFYLRGVAPKSVTTMQIYKGVVPFIIIQMIGLGLLSLFPGLATWLPTVIFG
ncbi:TRAP transporter large permease subunit [Terasakiella sp. A23]|uniref:TRAP transporter large permease n=1 Tax=Terasakiella sp. FCG-A23 TaxID=3080561 RepID=UPI0029544229|nr:TRAP transporter large permease subunit [Terasakiella sp. A23]MDV7338678.1 TRAP transporter large permease subunit [Terasakiella sp. A23]